MRLPFGEEANKKIKMLVNADIIKMPVDHIHLSKRQSDCLSYLAEGLTHKQIARQLQLSPRTVEHYLATVKEKFKCNNRAQLIAVGLKRLGQ